MKRKVIFIIVLTVITVGAISYFVFVKNSVPYASQAECEQNTGKQCYLFKGLCQVMKAQSKSEEEANEKFLKDCLPKIGTWQPTEEVTQRQQISLPTPDAPTLTFNQSDKPFIQINFDYSIAKFFNIYRSTSTANGWQKVISNFPSDAHTAVDFDYPKDAKILYYRIVSVDEQGQESAPSPSASISINQPQETIANWKIHTDSNLQYSFQYPPTSCELQRVLGDTSFALCYLTKGSDGGAKHNNGYVITLGFISQSQLNVMGITYCGAYSNDSSRCESFKIGKVTASIDWGTGGDASASAWISHPNGGMVTFDLQPVTDESKAILKSILSTFKFTN